MRLLQLLFASVLVVFAVCTTASANVLIKVDIPTQKMHVFADGFYLYEWPVATARPGMVTPAGTYQVLSMDRNHRSQKYHGAPMPFSLFFHGNYAIHGSYDTVGRPASHGCVRLYPKDAAILFALVQAYGSKNTIIVIENNR